jgi:putative tryptophan/tyrosine transport system substrate-binding protein
MRRRQVLLIGSATIAWMAIRPAFPQQAAGGRPRRIGGLFAQARSDPAEKRYWAAGENLQIEGRWVEGQPERYGPYAAELVSRGDIEVIVAVGTQATREAKMRTTTIPIVMIYTYDPVAVGLVASLARPGGNINQLNDILGKSVELLRELVPDLHRVFVLWQPSNPGVTTCLRGVEQTGDAPRPHRVVGAP